MKTMDLMQAQFMLVFMWLTAPFWTLTRSVAYMVGLIFHPRSYLPNPFEVAKLAWFQTWFRFVQTLLHLDGVTDVAALSPIPLWVAQHVPDVQPPTFAVREGLIPGMRKDGTYED